MTAAEPWMAMAEKPCARAGMVSSVSPSAKEKSHRSRLMRELGVLMNSIAGCNPDDDEAVLIETLNRLRTLAPARPAAPRAGACSELTRWYRLFPTPTNLSSPPSAHLVLTRAKHW